MAVNLNDYNTALYTLRVAGDGACYEVVNNSTEVIEYTTEVLAHAVMGIRQLQHLADNDFQEPVTPFSASAMGNVSLN